VFTDLWNLTQESEIGHIEAADRADLIVIAPATANLIARLAAGRADDALTAVVLASRAPVLLAPSMNVNMWENPLTQANLARLRERPRFEVVGPGEGFLACRWIGPGRLAEPIDIADAGAFLLSPQDLAGRRVAVTAGPTLEPLDPVRFLSNRSSGKMGYAVAQAARRRGAEVELITGPTALAVPLGVEATPIESALEMAEAVFARAGEVDAVIMVAAVADLRPAEVAAAKIKKSTLADPPVLPLARNPDILAELGRRRGSAGGRRPVLVGFAAETEDVLERGRGKLRAKGVDLIVANDVAGTDADAVFGADENRVIFIDRAGEEAMERAAKEAIAERIADRLVALLQASD
jgi:phosphopantothenoylcysteine decarboxylase/phosphopantothenate--cysteine ligase